MALPVAVMTAPNAFAGSTPPFDIGPAGNAVVPGTDADQTFTDLFGKDKELGPRNGSDTKVIYIHDAVKPMLGETNPNGQVDLRNAWVGTGQDTDEDDWLYFGWERDANTGSGFIAYEFMQAKVSAACDYENATIAQLKANCNPWENRQDGDFMILWDQQGGSLDLWLRTWSEQPDGSLVLSPPGDPLDASVSAAAYSADGFFGEAALNLTQTVFGGEHTCRSFANIIPSTVTGNSDTADYKDTILQPTVPIGNCTTTTTTTPQLGNGSPIPADQTITTDGVVEVRDSAYIQLDGGTATPGGTIDFSLCMADAGTDCDTTPVLVGDDVPVTGVAFPVTVNSPSAWVTSAGRYCWQAVYTGVSATGIGGSSDTSAGECFEIDPVTPGLDTAAGDDVVLGSAVTDDAVLTGTAPQPTTNIIETSAPDPLTRTAATGTITFKLYGPATGSCGTLVYDSSAQTPSEDATVSGDDTYSASTTPTAAGDYHWVAVYSGNSPNTNGASHNLACDDTDEDVTVGPASTTTVTTPQVDGSAITEPVAVNTSVTDHAVVTGTAAGGSPTGTVDFWICNPTEVTTNGGTCSSGGTAAGSKSLTPGASNTSTADSDPVVADVVGTWCFRAEYTPDTANYTGSSDSSTGECFTVKDSTSASSEQTWLPNDSATISSAGGTALNGTLSFTLFDSADCTGDVLRDAETFNLSGAASPYMASTSNSTVSVTASTTVSWKVEFTSSDSLVGSSSHCETTQLVITN